jgi:uncharacterized membrane protein (TIGR02234 family)
VTPEHVTPPENAGGSARARTPRLSSRAAALVLLAAGGALALVSSLQTWARLQADDTLGEISAAVSGAALVPLVPAAAVVGLAAVLAVPSVRGWVRRAVGAVVLGMGVVAGLSTATTLTAVTARAQQWWRVDVGVVAETAAVDVTWWWPALTLAGLATMAAGAGVVLLRGGQWAGLSARYERPNRKAGRQASRQPPTDGAPAATDADLWQALDRGEDPTSSV